MTILTLTRAFEAAAPAGQAMVARLRAAAVLCLLILASCGSSGNAVPTTVSDNPDQVLSMAEHAFEQLTSFHMNVTAQNVSLSLDAHIGGEHGVQMYLGGSHAGVTLEYVEIGTQVYYHGDELLRLQGRATQYPQVGTRWFLDPSADGSGGLNTFLDPKKTAHCLIQRHGGLSLVGTAAVSGMPAIQIAAVAGGAGTTPETYDIATDGSNRLLRIVQTGPTVNDTNDTCENFGANPAEAGPQVQIDFTNLNQVDPITPPHDALTLPR